VFSLNLNYFDLVNEFGLCLVFFNSWIYVYLLYTFFCILFLFDIKKMKTLNSLKNFGKLNIVTITIVMVLLSIAGIPPLAGFVSKFLLLNFLLFRQFFYFIILFSVVNFFALYFYLQCLRFLISKNQTNVFILKNKRVYLNTTIITILVLLNLFNFFGILFLGDVLYWFFVLILQKHIF